MSQFILNVNFQTYTFSRQNFDIETQLQKCHCILIQFCIIWFYSKFPPASVTSCTLLSTLKYTDNPTFGETGFGKYFHKKPSRNTSSVQFLFVSFNELQIHR